MTEKPKQIHRVASVKVLEDATGKPYLKIEGGDDCICITTNIAEMIGDVGAGARLRFEELKK